MAGGQFQPYSHYVVRVPEMIPLTQSFSFVIIYTLYSMFCLCAARIFTVLTHKYFSLEELCNKFSTGAILGVELFGMIGCLQRSLSGCRNVA